MYGQVGRQDEAEPGIQLPASAEDAAFPNPPTDSRQAGSKAEA